MKAFIAAGLMLAVFLFIAANVNGSVMQPFDQAALLWVNGFSSSALDTFFVAFTHLGGVEFLAIVTFLLIGLLLYKRAYAKALLVAFGIGGTTVLSFLLKATYGRVRPELWERIITETSYSFPSGHSVASAAFALIIIILLWKTRWRLAALIIGALFVFLIGMSRMYLGVHYPSDVLGGWLLAGTWVTVVAATIRYYAYRLRRRKEPVS